MSDTVKILCIIPAYNEEATIAPVIKGVLAHGYDVVVVNDASQDATVSVARGAGATVIEMPMNLGYAAAIQTGYTYAVDEGYDYVIQLDGDGQHDPEDASALLAPVMNDEADLVVASRYLSDSSYETGTFRRLGQHVFGFIAQALTGLKVTDPTSGYQAMTMEIVKLYTTGFFPDDYPDVDLIIALHRMGFRIREIGVRMHSDNGVSMHSGIWNAVYYIYKMTLAIFVSATCKLPERSAR
ncbi:glycosyltransferase family 2 protein [Pseudodesulfovibrio sp.]|nr:glycosyltransferase family 2 protein [Pseudodesulfovibrio sp.]